MNWSKVLGVMGMAWVGAFAQLQPGDVMFTGFNADAGNGESIALVVLKDIPAGDTLRFCDSEWNGTAFGADEGVFSWVNSSVTPAGTIIRIDSIASGTTTASVGTIIPALDSSGGIGNSDEAYFVFQGPATRVPTTFLTAVATRATSFGTLTGTGLTLGTSAMVFRTDIDVAAYTGPRSGLTKSGYQTALTDTTNWIFQDGSGNEALDAIQPDVPFSATAFTFPAPALQAGDIAFVGFNADGADNLAFVALKDIPANDTLRFCDSEWNGTGFGTDEGTFAWTTSTLVPAGTIVRIDSIGSGLTQASVGSIILDTSGGMGNSDEAMFVFKGTGSRNPTTFLAAIGTRATSFYTTPATSLAGTGLTVGTSAILLKTDVDIAAYTGPRSGLNQAGYLAALNDTLNWATQDGSGDQHLDAIAPDWPFSSTAFTFGTSALTDTVKPTISSVVVTNATVLDITFSEPVDSVLAVNLSNYSLSPTSAISAASYNKAQRKVTLTHAAFTSATTYTLQVSGIKDTANNTMATYTNATLVFTAPVPAISFNTDYMSVRENAGTIQVRLNASVTPSDTARVGIRILSVGTAVAGTDYTLTNHTFVWPKDSASPRFVNIPVVNNSATHPDKYFVIELHDPVKATLGTRTRFSTYILDDENHAPAGTSELDLKFVSSYRVDTTTGASAEILAHDPKSQRLFAMNSTRDRLEILNFRNPRAITKISTIDLLAFGTGGTSVAFHNGIVAVAIDTSAQLPGKVVFLDTNGVVKKSVKVGSLPDMVTFTPDGRYLLVANEGQPSNDYLTDPEGSVSIIDMQGGLDSVSQARVTTAGFTAFNGQEATLRAAGGRIFGLNATVAKDLEPEYITVSDDSKTAWVTLQENNIIARLDLQTKTFTNLFPLGMKDHSLARNALDASDQMDSIFMGTWPVKGVYMPDAIASLKVGDSTFLFTANEGDAREYGPINEDIRVGSSSYLLDTLVFPNYANLKLNTNIGRLSVSPLTGDTDNDGRMEEIHVLGARSFSVWNGATGAQVWDSGDELERITAADATYRSLFNASNDNNTRKNRSDNKGPEPEGITIGKIGQKHYAFIALERIGGVVAYDVTNPRAPKFVAWGNNRTTGALGGDLGSEGILFISKAQSPKDTAYVVLANEVSATVSVYSVRDTNSTVIGIRGSASDRVSGKIDVRHVAGQGMVYFSRPTDFKVLDLRGKVLLSGVNAPWADLASLQRGRYLLSLPGQDAVTLTLTK